ncbi:unnamed protein product [Linum tenue]|uniref:Uncharacterized protein n=1 Tax=Linum tenue TaxID=586396 RepID=A0AAV0P0C4_9ROSI|nr:unnamed protein product [Linum tenue]CAI0464251.1 unnamed protein product [Linum tenue]
MRFGPETNSSAWSTALACLWTSSKSTSYGRSSWS